MLTTPKSPTPATPNGAFLIANSSDDNISVACLIGSGLKTPDDQRPKRKPGPGGGKGRKKKQKLEAGNMADVDGKQVDRAMA